MDVAKGDEIMEKEEEEEEEEMLPGFRFHPTDEELVGFYLQRKVEKKPLRIELIKQIDIYKYDPWDLPKGCSVGEREWYFFCKRGRKYRNSIRPNRVTGSGFWKATGIDKPIYSTTVKKPHHDEDEECIIGLKKSLVYYRGSAGKGTKTDWMMHEFRLPPKTSNNHHNNPQLNAANDVQQAEVWTLCRIFKRIPAYKFTPNLNKDSKFIPVTKPRNYYSKACSFEESDNSSSSKQYLTFSDNSSSISPILQPKEILIRNNLFLGHLPNVNVPHHMITTPTTTTWSCWNQTSMVDEHAFENDNWDDLRSVVQFANNNIDPSKVYDCK